MSHEFNSFEVNGKVIGGGYAGSFVVATASVALTCVVTVSAPLYRYGTINQPLAFEVSLIPGYQTPGTVISSLAFSGTVEPSVWTPIPVGFRGVLAAVGEVLVQIRRANTMELGLELVADLPARAFAAVPSGDIDGVLSLVGTAAGNELSVGAAPSERTIIVPVSNRAIVVPHTTSQTEV